MYVLIDFCNVHFLHHIVAPSLMTWNPKIVVNCLNVSVANDFKLIIGILIREHLCFLELLGI